MLVNEQFEETYLNDGKPIVGRRYAGLLAPNVTAEIVGVVGNVLKNGLADAPRSEIYVALGNHGLITMGREINLVIRSVSDPRGLTASLRSIVSGLDPTAPVHNVAILSTALTATAGESRFSSTMVWAFAALALGLATIGLFGVLSFNVMRRRREFAVRTALGARRQDLIVLVVKEGMGLTMVGVAVGVCASFARARVMRTLMVAIDSPDTVSLAIGQAILAVVALAACLIPAWRASAFDPVDALKSE